VAAVAEPPQQPHQPSEQPPPESAQPSLAQAVKAADEKMPVEAEGEAGKPRTQAAGTAAESTLCVDVTLLNRMMNLVGNLVLTRNQVLLTTAADPNPGLLSRRLEMVTADLRNSVMKARMQPVSNIFSKMPRIVRDLSQSLGRRVRLEMEGQETELWIRASWKPSRTHLLTRCATRSITALGRRMCARPRARIPKGR
jgi:two-component system chemotaxis sensor kinase CheA